MQIKEIINNKKDFMDILLIGDEQESSVMKYLEKGNLFALYDDTRNLKTACATIEIDDETVEIKNIATYSDSQNNGYASALIEFLCNKYKEEFRYIILGTGENDIILNFYKKRGFVEFNKIKDFFIENYDHPIFENNKQLIDMIYLKRKLQ